MPRSNRAVGDAVATQCAAASHRGDEGRDLKVPTDKLTTSQWRPSVHSERGCQVVIAQSPGGARALAAHGGRARIAASRAGVTQLAECLLPKQNVAGSNPVSRSTSATRSDPSDVLRSQRVEVPP